MVKINTETETVVKKIIPYLKRRGYDIDKDLSFELGVNVAERYSKGYIDILVIVNDGRPKFLIEAKKISKKLTASDRDQAVSYARSKEVNVPFAVVTNGIDIQCYNVKTKQRILWDGKLQDKIPTKEQLKTVLAQFKVNPEESLVKISNDDSLPFRPGLALRQLNSLFYKCHSTIRKIEKNEESAFSDFSKLLFLKLLEEKADLDEDFKLPYSYRFYELAEKPQSESDQVRDSVNSMIRSIVERTSYGDVLQERILLKNPKTFHYIIKELASVSFCDCSLDSKGAAFEYFVRATLKGKKLGQYFTPRELVQTMLSIVGQNKIVNSVVSGSKIKIFDPACGTGGFLVFLMQDTLLRIGNKYASREMTKANYVNAVKLVKEDIFFGSDANEGVAASAKMNMIIAGDGHTNIRNEDSLSINASNWSVDNPDCDLILTNPPFGTSEGESLSADDWRQYDLTSAKGQYLFLQKMVKCLKADGGEICTVIDEGVLNTDSASSLRKWLLKKCRLKAVISLPSETFKPNKINVRSSLLYLERRAVDDSDYEDVYLVKICKIDSLGYNGAGDKLRSFDLERFLKEISDDVLSVSSEEKISGYCWEAYAVKVQDIASDPTSRFDYKYWDREVRTLIDDLKHDDGRAISEINLIKTARGKSPSSDNYVDKEDGYAIVIKAGSNISKFGDIILEDADWVEKSLYDEILEQSIKENDNRGIILRGDVLLSSTGDGTLGKSAVYDLDYPAVADGHVTIIRVDPEVLDPYYLCDYLRHGYGAIQIERLFTGSTGMIELTPEQVNSIVIDMRASVLEQKNISKRLRSLETEYKDTIKYSEGIIEKVEAVMLDKKEDDEFLDK